MSVSVRVDQDDRTGRCLIKTSLPFLVVLLTLPAARDAAAESNSLAPVFMRKTVDDNERRARVERAERRQEQASQAVEPETQHVVASPSDIERVLRAALTNVNSGRTEILVRTGDWDRLAPAAESGQTMGLNKRKRAERSGTLKRVAVVGANPSSRRVSGVGAATRDPIETLAQSDTLHIELQPGRGAY